MYFTVLAKSIFIRIIENFTAKPANCKQNAFYWKTLVDYKL